MADLRLVEPEEPEPRRRLSWPDVAILALLLLFGSMPGWFVMAFVGVLTLRLLGIE